MLALQSGQSQYEYFGFRATGEGQRPEEESVILRLSVDCCELNRQKDT